MSDAETGVIEAHDDRYTLTLVRHLQAKIREVWAAITEPIELEEWLAPVQLEPAVGGAVRIDFGGDEVVHGTVLRFEPPAVFEFSWGGAGEGDPSVVRFELHERGGETVLRLTHHNQRARLARSTAAGWHAHVDLLDGRLRGEPGSWDESYARAKQRYAPIVAAALG